MVDENKDAVAMLKADHREVEALFEAFEVAESAGQKRALAEQICTALTVHAKLEEGIFYPACRSTIENQDLVDEALVEHDGAKVLINEIEAGGPDEDFYDAKVKVLKEQIQHHIEEEEKIRGNIFQQARAADVDLEALGERMAERKAELMRMAETEGLPPAEPATMSSGA